MEEVKTPGNGQRPRPGLDDLLRLQKERVRGLFRIGWRFLKPEIPADYTGSITYHWYKGGLTNVEIRQTYKNSDE